MSRFCSGLYSSGRLHTCELEPTTFGVGVCAEQFRATGSSEWLFIQPGWSYPRSQHVGTGFREHAGKTGGAGLFTQHLHTAERKNKTITWNLLMLRRNKQQKPQTSINQQLKLWRNKWEYKTEVKKQKMERCEGTKKLNILLFYWGNYNIVFNIPSSLFSGLLDDNVVTWWHLEHHKDKRRALFDRTVESLISGVLFPGPC